MNREEGTQSDTPSKDDGKFFNELSAKDEQDYIDWVANNQSIQEFIDKASVWHPVIRREIAKRLTQ